MAGVFAGGGGFTPVFVGAALVTAITTAAASLITNAAPAAIYYALRRSKEGAGPAELAAIFD